MANVNNDKALGGKQLAGGEMLENNAQATQAPAQAPKASSKKPNDKNKKKNDGKQNVFIRMFKRIGLSFKNMKNELKNVTWPTFGKVIASTGVVLIIVAIFFVLLLGIDLGLGSLFDLIIHK